MKETSGPKVTMSSLKTGYTEVIYCPDFERLGNFSSDIIGIFRKRIRCCNVSFFRRCICIF